MSSAHQLIAWPRHDTPLGDICYGGILEGEGGTGFGAFRRLGLHALVLLWRGAGAYVDESGHCQRLEAGDIVLIEPDLAHQYGPDQACDWHEIYICFRGETLARQFQSLRDSAGGPVMRIRDPLAWRERLWSILRDPPVRGADAVSRMSLFQVCLADLLAAAPSRFPRTDDWLNTALSLLRTSDTPLPQIAQRCGLSYTSFRFQFRSRTGRSPGAVRHESRLGKAALLLEQMRLPIGMIAERCGFYDGAHLSHCFKAHFGVPPSTWRRNRMDGQG